MTPESDDTGQLSGISNVEGAPTCREAGTEEVVWLSCQ